MIAHPQREKRYPILTTELELVYVLSRDFGVYSPYDYLFRLPSDVLETDLAVWLLGRDAEEKELEEKE